MSVSVIPGDCLATLCELNPEYARLARERITADAPLLAGVA